jgi:hypothetical protein
MPSPIATPTSEFPDEDTWGQQTYIDSERALTTLEHTIGTSKMMAAMRAYVRAWMFRHPSGRDLFDAIAREQGESLEWYVGPVFTRVGGLELAVRDIGCWPTHAPRGVFGDSVTKTVTETDAPDTGAWTCSLELASTGTIHVPVEVELRFGDGSSERRTWDDRDGATWTRIALERSAPIVEIRVDPDGKLALDSPLAHDYRIEGDGAASLRAAARVGSWTQTLMQLVGL